MILLCGIETEDPLALVRAELDRMEARYVVFNQRRFDEMDLSVEVRGPAVGGTLRVGSETHRLEEFKSVYTRLMDDALLPELADEAPGTERRSRCRALHDLLVGWYEIAPARVLNRASAMASNQSKPYQSQLIREYGFHVPETLVTSDPEAALAFRKRHGRVVYKSTSGIRSIVRVFDDEAARRLEAIRWCPVQFQELVEGTDLRVHVVGEEVLATEIRSNVADYRYAHREDGGRAELRATAVDDSLAARCLALAHGLALPLAGLDLRRRADGRFYCFEVNPSPGFSYFERGAGQPIAASIATYLERA